MAFDRIRVQALAAEQAAHGVYLGTSSWKYEGWMGQLYHPESYAYRGKFARTRFERNCLAQYAEVFKTVCVDSAYYGFPRPDVLCQLADQVPVDFRFGFKVTDAITIKRFPNLERFGAQAGKPNPDFLNADLFGEAFLKPCEAIRERIGIIIFEFSRFWPSDYARGRDFLAELDRFLSQLPHGWPLSVELRNRQWLAPDYFGCLARRGVAHVYNSWQAMPAVHEQIALPHSRTHPNLVAARLLLKPGRTYQDAVRLFQPYAQIREAEPEIRSAAVDLIRTGRQTPGGSTFIYVNNRLEGNAPATIAAMLELAA